MVLLVIIYFIGKCMVLLVSIMYRKMYGSASKYNV